MSRAAQIAFALSALLTAGAIWLLVPQERPAAAPRSTVQRAAPRTLAPPVRILLSPAVRTRLRLAVAGPYRVVQPGDWRVVAQGSRLPEVEVGAHERRLAIGEQSWPLVAVEVQVIEPRTLTLDGEIYPGNVRLLRLEDGRFSAINVASIEDYADGVVAAERNDITGGVVETSTLQALAIGARTTALYRMKTAPSTAAFDLSDGPSPRYAAGLSKDAVGFTSVESAAKATAGIALVYHDRIFLPLCTPQCSGQTLHGPEVLAEAAPPLTGVACAACHQSPAVRWSAEIELSTIAPVIELHFAQRGLELGELTSIRSGPAGPGRIAQLQLSGVRGRQSLSGCELYELLHESSPLPSPCFTLQQEGAVLKLNGWGHGLGAGLCLAGADKLAASGANASAILRHYFPGSTLRQVQ